MALRRMLILSALVALFLSEPASSAQQAAPATRRVAIKAGRLVEGTTAPAIENAVIIVNGDRIEAVGPAANVQIPADARVIDLSADTVLPGLINGHDHPTVRAFVGTEVDRQGRNSLIMQLNQMAEPPAIQAARGVRNLRVDVLSGVTSQYVVGENQWNDVNLKRREPRGAPGGRRTAAGVRPVHRLSRSCRARPSTARAGLLLDRFA
jgi:hypothetical protein